MIFMTTLIKMTVDNLTMYQKYVLQSSDALFLDEALKSLYQQIETSNYQLDMNEAIVLNDLHQKICNELRMNTYLTFDFFIKKDSFFN